MSNTEKVFWGIVNFIVGLAFGLVLFYFFLDGTEYVVCSILMGVANMFYKDENQKL